MKFWSVVADTALVAVVTYHLWVSPYTKVEESFNIQAIHDLVTYGPSHEAVVSAYDHVHFPGAVPRTFIGAVVVAIFTKAIVAVAQVVGFALSGFHTQLVARGVIGAFNVWSLVGLRRTVNRISFAERKSPARGLTGWWFSVLLLTQFHLLYYASRPLANFMALPLVNYALAKLLRGDMLGLTWLAFTGVVFRLEIGLLAGLVGLVSAAFGQSHLPLNVIMLVAGTVVGAVASFLVDSYFWDYLLIPELVSFKFNILQGKSADWGTEPFVTYFFKYLPQLFGKLPIVLVLVLPGLASDPAYLPSKPQPDVPSYIANHPSKNSLRILFVASVLYIVGMSFQPHKEWRFIVYVVPVFTLVAANGLASISRKYNLWATKLLLLLVLALTSTASVVSVLMGFVSSYNYPGGDAIAFVNSVATNNTVVHLDVAACMTGVTRFTQVPGVIYDKTENSTELQKIWDSVDILVTDKSEVSADWRQIHTSPKYESITIVPVVWLVYQQTQDPTTIRRFVWKIVEPALHNDWAPFVSFLNLFVVRSDYLYVYERVANEPVAEPVKEDEHVLDVHEVEGVPDHRVIDTPVLDDIVDVDDGLDDDVGPRPTVSSDNVAQNSAPGYATADQE